jgi:hypothetical protein
MLLYCFVLYSHVLLLRNFVYTFVMKCMEEWIMSEPNLSSRPKCLEHLCVLDSVFVSYWKRSSLSSLV